MAFTDYLSINTSNSPLSDKQIIELNLINYDFWDILLYLQRESLNRFLFLN